MVKMYNAEVLSKFPVVQHFPFGSLFSWEQDPNARVATAIAHTASQPTGHSTPSGTGVTRLPAQESTMAPWDNPEVGAVPSTAAPWAKTPTIQPSTRAPWADGRGGQQPLDSARTAAMPPPSQMPDGPTRAPWADRGGSGGG
jgi:serine/threonine-protein phosphatase 2A activator